MKTKKNLSEEDKDMIVNEISLVLKEMNRSIGYLSDE